MKLTRWEPLNDIVSLQNEVNRLFNDNLFNRGGEVEKLNGWAPSLDVSENQEGYQIKADLPGLNKDDITISLTGNTLTLKGERKSTHEETKGTFYRKEISYGSFQRQVTFSHDVHSEGIKANYQNGVLELNIPKSEKAKTRKISID